MSGSNFTAFNINGVVFSQYYAKDSHGSICDVKYVDGKVVTAREYRIKLRKLIAPFNNMIYNAAKENHLGMDL